MCVHSKFFLRGHKPPLFNMRMSKVIANFIIYYSQLRIAQMLQNTHYTIVSGLCPTFCKSSPSLFALHREQLIHEDHLEMLFIPNGILSSKWLVYNSYGTYITFRLVCKLCKIEKNKKHRKRIKMQIVFYKGKSFSTNKERTLAGVIPIGFLNTWGQR